MQFYFSLMDFSKNCLRSLVTHAMKRCSFCLNFSSDVFHQIFRKRENSELLSGCVIPPLKIELRHQR